MAALAAAATLAALPPGGVAACIGLPGSGKTTVAQRALDAVAWGQRAALFDPYALRDRANWRAGYRARRPWWAQSPADPPDALLKNPRTLDRTPLRLAVRGTRR